MSGDSRLATELRFAFGKLVVRRAKAAKVTAEADDTLVVQARVHVATRAGQIGRGPLWKEEKKRAQAAKAAEMEAKGVGQRKKQPLTRSLTNDADKRAGLARRPGSGAGSGSGSRSGSGSSGSGRGGGSGCGSGGGQGD
jgi:uncharacterized membrane protein YgcG